MPTVSQTNLGYGGSRHDSMTPPMPLPAEWTPVLFEAIELWQAILDNMGEAVLVADASGTVLLNNPAAARLFPTKHQPTFCPGEHEAPFALQPLERCVRGEGFDNWELYVPASPLLGSRWVTLTGRPLRDAEGKIRGGIMVGHDITARKHAERRQHLQYAIAQALATSEHLSDSAADVLHQLCGGLGMDVGVLWIANDADDELECIEVWSRPGLELQEFMLLTRKAQLRLGMGLPGQVWLSARPAWEALDVANWAFDRVGLAVRAGLHGACAFPVRQGPAAVGVLEFFSRLPRDADDETADLLAALGSQIGQVLQRQRVEKALRDSETLFESLVESLPQNIFRKDLAGRFVFANERFCQTVKKHLKDIIGKTDFDLFPLDLAAKYVRDDRHLVELGEPLETVEEHRTPDGKRLSVQVVKTVVLDAVGNTVGVQGIFWDVTEKTIAIEMLSHSEHRYRQLTEATLDGIILTDERSIVLLFNPAAERMFGYRAAEVIGQPGTMLVPADRRGEHERERVRYLESRGASDMFGRTSEMLLRRKDGSEFPCEVTLTVLSATDDPAGPVQFLAGIRDLTERNRMRAAAVQNDKLASIGLLSAGVAHEINNPLAFVSNNLAVLERDCLGLLDLVTLLDANHDLADRSPEFWTRWQAKGEEIDVAYVKENLARLLGRTRDGIDRVTRIVQSLRGLARTDSPCPQEVDLCHLIDGSLEIIKGKYKDRDIETLQSHPQTPRLLCVSTQMSQVILNLLVNAFQAVESARKLGGKIWIRTRTSAAEVVLEVEDNGPGIAPEIVPKVFDPFFTTKDVGEGTGLGLSISHHIVASHGGRLEVDGNPGRGACFRVVLPVKPPQEFTAARK
jgi:two-component system NtrC family sensor kinase